MGKPPVSGVVWCVHDYEPREYTHHPKDAAGISVFSEGGSHTFATRIDAIRQQGAPVFLGEFGASRWLRDIDAYYRVRIDACEARSIGWAAFRWPTGDAAYEKSDDMFNLMWGPKADDWRHVRPGRLGKEQGPAWRRWSARAQLAELQQAQSAREHDGRERSPRAKAFLQKPPAHHRGKHHRRLTHGRDVGNRRNRKSIKRHRERD
jgi:hypothetical protein